MNKKTLLIVGGAAALGIILLGQKAGSPALAGGKGGQAIFSPGKLVPTGTSFPTPQPGYYWSWQGSGYVQVKQDMSTDAVKLENKYTGQITWVQAGAVNAFLAGDWIRA